MLLSELVFRFGVTSSPMAECELRSRELIAILSRERGESLLLCATLTLPGRASSCNANAMPWRAMYRGELR